MREETNQNEQVARPTPLNFNVGMSAEALFEPKFAGRNVPCFVVSEDELNNIGQIEIRAAIFIALASLAFGGALSVWVTEIFTNDPSPRAQTFFLLALPSFCFIGLLFSVMAGVEIRIKYKTLKNIKNNSTSKTGA